MNLLLRITCALSATALVLVISGCDRGPARIVIKGKVTYKGAKVADGWITFAPKNADKGTQEAAHIVDGSYALPSDHGLVPGTYGVAITATEGSGKPAQKEAPGAPKRSQSLIPDEYNRNSKLSIEVTPTSNRNLDFNLD